MKNSAYHGPDLVDNKANTIYIVYKIRDYDNTGTEHNFVFSCGMSDNRRGVCFLKVGKTMRVYGVTIWIFRISLPVTLIHVEGINGTLSV